jgi:hypothetical protein
MVRQQCIFLIPYAYTQAKDDEYRRKYYQGRSCNEDVFLSIVLGQSRRPCRCRHTDRSKRRRSAEAVSATESHLRGSVDDRRGFDVLDRPSCSLVMLKGTNSRYMEACLLACTSYMVGEQYHSACEGNKVVDLKVGTDLQGRADARIFFSYASLSPTGW